MPVHTRMAADTGAGSGNDCSICFQPRSKRRRIAIRVCLEVDAARADDGFRNLTRLQTCQHARRTHRATNPAPCLRHRSSPDDSNLARKLSCWVRAIFAWPIAPASLFRLPNSNPALTSCGRQLTFLQLKFPLKAHRATIPPQIHRKPVTSFSWDPDHYEHFFSEHRPSAHCHSLSGRLGANDWRRPRQVVRSVPAQCLQHR